MEDAIAAVLITENDDKIDEQYFQQANLCVSVVANERGHEQHVVDSKYTWVHTAVLFWQSLRLKMDV